MAMEMEGDGFFIRMAQPCDSAAVEATFRSALPRLRDSFGFPDFSTLIENSLYPLVGLSPDDEVIAFAAFNDAPSVPGVVSGKRATDAKAWAAKEASSHGFSAHISMWIEVFASSSTDSNSQEKHLKCFLSTVFKLFPEARAIFVLSSIEHASVLGVLKPISHSQDMDLMLSVCLQSAVLPTVNIKQAVVENYDDLFPLVENAQNEGCCLSKIPNSAAPMYPFAMARLIAAQDANNHVLIAEVEHKLIGVMAVTSELDSNICFGPELDDFIRSASLEHGKDVNDLGEKKMHPVALTDNKSISLSSADDCQQKSTHKINQTNLQSVRQDAFQITMFCLEEEFGHRAIDLLMASFVFEGKDFCIVQLRYNSKAPDFLRCFTRLPKKESTAKVTEADEVLLYILYRQSLSSSFEVRSAKPQDIERINDLSKGFQDRNLIQLCVEMQIKGCMAMVASCQKEVVGFALIDTNCPIEALVSHFDLREYAQQQEANQGAVITLFFINPFFANRQRLFFREIMQQVSKNSLFLPVFQAKDMSNAVEDMVLVPGRWHSYMYPPCTWVQGSLHVPPSSRSSLCGSTTTNPATSEISHYIGFDCALFAMTHKLLSRQKTIVNSRIVIIGASQAAAACLSKLITSTNLKFSSLILVSPGGLRTLLDSGKTFSDVELGPANAFQKMGINCLVQVITDTVIDLDKKAKNIHLLSGNHVQYDYLILSTGLQDQTRSKIQVSSDKGVVRLDELSIMINENARDFTNTDSPVVIYGLSIQTFCSIHLLLSKGIPGSLLVVVYPELVSLDSFAEQCFKDSLIAASVMKEVRAAGVVERSGFKLLEVTHEEGKNVLQGIILEKIFRASLNFSNQNENTGICIKQPCRLLVACMQPHVDHALFRALRKEGLVFNGRIVVDGNFQTNDPNIFACGSVAKFSRQCGKQLNHESFNSCELGQTLAKTIVGLFTDHLPVPDRLWAGLLPDPFEAIPQASLLQTWPRTSIPRFIQAKGISVLLPGSFRYFHISCPVVQGGASKDAPMQPLIVKKDDWLLKIELTKAREIRSMIYCGKTDLEAWKFVRLVGCRDPLINNLLIGNSKAIMNISNFFSQPWVTLIVHDKFLDFYTNLSREAYQILDDSPQEQNLVFEVVKDRFVTFLNAYKADFPGLNISSPWFASKLQGSSWRGKGNMSSNTTRHCKARTKKQDEVTEELRRNQKDEVCAPAEKTEQAGSTLQDGTTKLLLQGKLELAVERIVEQKVKGEGSMSTEGGNKGQSFSRRKELELVVGKMVEQIGKGEGLNNRISECERNAELTDGKAVAIMVRQIMEKLVGEEGKQEDVSIVTVKLAIIDGEEAGVLVQKVHVKLLLKDGASSRIIPWVSDLLDSSESVNLQFLIDDDEVGSVVGEGKRPVRVHFKYPYHDGFFQQKPSSVSENLVKVMLNLGRENNISVALITDTENCSSSRAF